MYFTLDNNTIIPGKISLLLRVLRDHRDAHPSSRASSLLAIDYYAR